MGDADGSSAEGSRLTFSYKGTRYEAEHPEEGREAAPPIWDMLFDPVTNPEPWPPHDHSINYVIEEVTIDFDTIAAGWAWHVSVPFQIKRQVAGYHLPDGTDFLPAYGDIHHRNQLDTGIGDMKFRCGPVASGPGWSWDVGLSLPTGATVEDPFAAGDLGEKHDHLYFGTGTADPLGRLRWSGEAMLLSFSLRLPVYESSEGLLGGLELVSAVIWRLPEWGGVRWRAGYVLQAISDQNWSGERQAETRVFTGNVSVGGAMALGGGQLDLSLLIPIHQLKMEHGDQLKQFVLVSASMSVPIG